MKDYKVLFDAGNWMIRTSDNGKSYNGFQWQPVGEWTEALDWNTIPKCGGGLHGQTAKAHGYFQISGERLELCETSEQIVIGGDKVKCQKAKLVAVNEDIPLEFLEVVGLTFYCDASSLKTLASIGGYLHINSKVGADLPVLAEIGKGLYINSEVSVGLPALVSIGKDLYISFRVRADLPALAEIGGYLSINSEVSVGLPALVSIGGGLSIYSDANLPALVSIGGRLSIYSDANLPALASIGGGLYINSEVSLPALTSIGGGLSIYSKVKADLPALTSVNGKKGKYHDGRFYYDDN